MTPASAKDTGEKEHQGRAPRDEHADDPEAEIGRVLPRTSLPDDPRWTFSVVGVAGISVGFVGGTPIGSGPGPGSGNGEGTPGGTSRCGVSGGVGVRAGPGLGFAGVGCG